MSLFDALPPGLRAKARERQDFEIEEKYQAQLRIGYAPDEEDA